MVYGGHDVGNVSQLLEPLVMLLVQERELLYVMFSMVNVSSMSLLNGPLGVFYVVGHRIMIQLATFHCG